MNQQINWQLHSQTETLNKGLRYPIPHPNVV